MRHFPMNYNNCMFYKYAPGTPNLGLIRPGRSTVRKALRQKFKLLEYSTSVQHLLHLTTCQSSFLLGLECHKDTQMKAYDITELIAEL